MKKLAQVITYRLKDGGGTENQLTAFYYDLMGRPQTTIFPDGTRVAARRWSVAILIAMVCAACGAENGKTADSSHDKRQRLFTWTASEDKLCFVLVPFAQRDKFVRGWFQSDLGTVASRS